MNKQKLKVNWVPVWILLGVVVAVLIYVGYVKRLVDTFKQEELHAAHERIDKAFAPIEKSMRKLEESVDRVDEKILRKITEIEMKTRAMMMATIAASMGRQMISYPTLAREVFFFQVQGTLLNWSRLHPPNTK